MRKVVMLMVVIFHANTYAKDNTVLFKNKENGFLKLVEVNNKTYLITSFGISIVDKNSLVNKASIPDSCSDAAIFKNTIILATNTGLKVFNPSDNSLLSFLPDSIHAEINHVAVDKLGRLWFSEKLNGCYMLAANNTIYKKVEAPVIYSLACTPDSNVWVGTNIGMYKIPPQGTEVFRFVEEGLEGFELPDNLVERIFADDHSNVWAMMPDYLVFIPSANFQGEIPNYTSVGNKSNIIFDISKIPVTARSYLFCTSQGVIYLADIIGDALNHTGEIHQVFSEKAISINDSTIRKPSALKNDDILAVKIIDKKSYFITQNGFWSIPTKDFIHQLNKKA